MRGSESLVRCDNCGRTVPRAKAVMDEKMIRYGTDMNNRDIKFQTSRKVYYCISCAKHKGVFQRKAEQAARHAARAAAGPYHERSRSFGSSYSGGNSRGGNPY